MAQQEHTHVAVQRMIPALCITRSAARLEHPSMYDSCADIKTCMNVAPVMHACQDWDEAD